MELDELLKVPAAELKRGTFNDAVVVQGRWVARFPRTATALADAPRRAKALTKIAALGLPFSTPEVIDDHLDLPLGRAHVVISYLPGEPSDTANDGAVRTVLDALAEVELDDELDRPARRTAAPRGRAPRRRNHRRARLPSAHRGRTRPGICKY